MLSLHAGGILYFLFLETQYFIVKVCFFNESINKEFFPLEKMNETFKNQSVYTCTWCPRERLQKTHANRERTSKSRNIFISLTAGSANARHKHIQNSICSACCLIDEVVFICRRFFLLLSSLGHMANVIHF